MSIGDRFRYLRESNKMTTREVADLLNISRSTVSTIENDKNSPSLDIVVKYIEQFKVDSHWLIYGEKAKLELSDNEIELLNVYRKLPEREQLKVIGYIESKIVEPNMKGFIESKEKLSV